MPGMAMPRCHASKMGAGSDAAEPPSPGIVEPPSPLSILLPGGGMCAEVGGWL